MQRILVLVRHAKAQARGEGVDDFDRQLTRAGKLAAKALYPQAMALVPASARVSLWSSPAARALQTAECVADALDLPKDACQMHECLWQQDAVTFFEELQACDADVVIAVGHNPFIEVTGTELTGMPVQFEVGAAMAIALSDDPAPKADPAGEADPAPKAEPAGEAEPAAEVPDGASNDGAPNAGQATPHGSVRWFAQGLPLRPYKTMAAIERVLEQVARTADRRAQEFLEQPDDVETLHQLRVCIRTLRSLLSFTEPFVKAGWLRDMQKSLRDVVLETSHLRNLDVLTQQVMAMELPADDLVAACHSQRQAECRRVQKLIASKATQKVLKQARDGARRPAWKSVVLRDGIEPQTAERRFKQMLRQFRQERDDLDIADVEQTHAVRKHAKRIRYIAERYSEIIGGSTERVSREMVEVQDQLGALCDARALMELLADFPCEGLSDEALCDISLLRVQQEQTVYTALKQQLRDVEE